VHRSAGILVAFMVAVSLLVGARTTGHHAKVHVEPLVNFALPPASAGCTGATALGGGAERIPITVSSVSGQVAELVNVCIGGQGPYPFVIDSGAGESIIDARLAAKLNLAPDGSSSEFAGVGCTGKAQPVDVSAWSVAGVSLAPQVLTAATLPDFGVAGQPVGLLGSDVLSRFGGVRIDFTAQTLTFGAAEGAVISNSSEQVRGPMGPSPSAVLTQGETGTTVPVSVALTPGDISINVRLRFGSGAQRDFIVDTGSSASVVAKSVATSAHLAPSDLAQRQTTVCSTITVPLVHSGRWSVPGVILHPQLLGAANFGVIGGDGTDGLLGSDQLQRFGWVIFDYSGGRLILG
jgi:Aspartyl protease